MKETVLEHLRCAECQDSLRWQTFRDRARGEIADGTAWCPTCRNWYPIDDGLLELLPPHLGYTADRQVFWDRHRPALASLGLRQPEDIEDRTAVAAQRQQQEHFDWYAGNDSQTYSAYERMPFWQTVDAMVFDGWRQQLKPGGWLLDVGCAQGRSTFQMMEEPLHVVGFDVSKALVRQAIEQYRRKPHRAEATFFVGDASKLPFTDRTFDYVLIYGVLHHLPNPAETCRDVARVLKPGGVYFGSENNQTAFRRLFDLLMRINPLWHEEAGAQPLISAQQLHQWFAATPVQIECTTHVFVLPHMVNWLGRRWGGKLLHFGEHLGRKIGFLRHNGGLIMVRGEHRAC